MVISNRGHCVLLGVDVRLAQPLTVPGVDVRRMNDCTFEFIWNALSLNRHTEGICGQRRGKCEQLPRSTHPLWSITLYNSQSRTTTGMLVNILKASYYSELLVVEDCKYGGFWLWTFAIGGVIEQSLKLFLFLKVQYNMHPVHDFVSFRHSGLLFTLNECPTHHALPRLKNALQHTIWLQRPLPRLYHLSPFGVGDGNNSYCSLSRQRRVNIFVCRLIATLSVGESSGGHIKGCTTDACILKLSPFHLSPFCLSFCPRRRLSWR